MNAGERGSIDAHLSRAGFHGRTKSVSQTKNLPKGSSEVTIFSAAASDANLRGSD
jgi:hypothetical protein